MNDPVELLMALAAEATSPFAAISRYRNCQIATATRSDGRQVRFVRRRFVPQPEQMASLAEHHLVSGDRLDNLAQRYYGDPELFWQVCDGNRVLRPADLTDEYLSDAIGFHNCLTSKDPSSHASRSLDPTAPRPPRIIRIGMPVGVPGPEVT